MNPGSLPTTHVTSITTVCTFPELHSILVLQGGEKKTRQLFFNNSSLFGFWILCCSHYSPRSLTFLLTFSLLPSLTLLSSCISSLDSHLASGVDSLQVQSLFSSFFAFLWEIPHFYMASTLASFQMTFSISIHFELPSQF